MQLSRPAVTHHGRILFLATQFGGDHLCLPIPKGVARPDTSTLAGLATQVDDPNINPAAIVDTKRGCRLPRLRLR
jgi:hypothetical protein